MKSNERYKIWCYQTYQNKNGDWEHNSVHIAHENSLQDAKDYLIQIKQCDWYLKGFADEELRITKEIYEEIIPGFFEWNEVEGSELLDFEIMEKK